MSGSHGYFATVIKCMDGRDLEAVTTFVKKLTNADFVDTITWPGPDKALAEDPAAQDHFERCVGISVNKHVSHEKIAALVIEGRFPEVKVRHGHVDHIDGHWVAKLNE